MDSQSNSNIIQLHMASSTTSTEAVTTDEEAEETTNGADVEVDEVKEVEVPEPDKNGIYDLKTKEEHM